MSLKYSGVRITGALKQKDVVVSADPLPAPSTDPFFNNVTFLIQPTQSDTTIVDKSNNIYEITNSNVILDNDGTDSTLKSLDFLGSVTTKFLTVTGDIFSFGTNEDFTYEFWLKAPVYDTGNFNTLIDTDGSVRTVIARAGGEIDLNGNLYFDNGDSAPTSYDTYPSNQWFHLAVCRSSNNLRLFINGVQESVSSNFSTDYLGITLVTIGNTRANNTSLPSRNFDGLVGSIRFTDGVARYTTDFTPDTVFGTT